ncbi:SNAP receptor complex member 2 [Seminavis robusta]|uniref:SNAP receptor complex member 2 n=1 Tax=Seminavis robusta TaxID=568900 RepID=A0A9N8DC18_9STRA|nr:SNAP receptor complex member 2 [Seminavis robusta]|eukprot:Sro83_g044550.1 SNAP receptor complex member 2 (213) ;mRNA; f:113665-114303
MTSIVELFPKCRKLAYDSRQQLSQVENGLLRASELFLVLDELGMQLDIMDQLVQRETPAQREVWKRKILELREESKSLRRLGEDYDRRMNANLRHQRERDELLRRRKQRTPHSNIDERDMSNLADEGKSLQQSQLMVSEIIASGEASLNGLIEQRQRLGGITRTIFDIGNRLGLTQSTMRIIERRDITDFYLVVAGMVVTLIVLYLVWFVEW